MREVTETSTVKLIQDPTNMGSYMECEGCGQRWTPGEHPSQHTHTINKRVVIGYSPSCEKTESTIDGYGLICGKTETTIERAIINYN